jgi:hypothetical protein
MLHAEINFSRDTVQTGISVESQLIEPYDAIAAAYFVVRRKGRPLTFALPQCPFWEIFRETSTPHPIVAKSIPKQNENTAITIIPATAIKALNIPAPTI